MAIEEPDHEILERIDDVEIRRYAPLVVAETTVDATFDRAGNAGFRRLAGYIFGGNRAREGDGAAKIAMTAPVGMRAEEGTKIAMTAPVGTRPEAGADGRWVVSFVMPSEWSLDTLPVPDDDRVELREVPERTVAALRFSGTWSSERFAEHENELRAALEGSGWTPVGVAESARYDPPWTLWFLRRNEVIVEVVEAGSGGDDLARRGRNREAPSRLATGRAGE